MAKPIFNTDVFIAVLLFRAAIRASRKTPRILGEATPALNSGDLLAVLIFYVLVSNR
jgi:hypothetical protein